MLHERPALSPAEWDKTDKVAGAAEENGESAARQPTRLTKPLPAVSSRGIRMAADFRPTPSVGQISVKIEAYFGGLCPYCLLDTCGCNRKPMRQNRKAKDFRPTPPVCRIKTEDDGDGERGG